MRSLLFILLTCASLHGLADAADPLDDVNKRFEQRQREVEGALESVQAQYAAKRAAMDAVWKQREEEIAEKWRRIEQAIEQKWDRAERSTQRDWIEYSSSYDTRSLVNFEDGSVDITTLIPAAQRGAWHRPDAGQPRTVLEPAGPLHPWLRLVSWTARAWAVAESPPGWDQIVQHLQALMAEETKPGTPILAEQVRTRTGAPVTQESAKSFLEEDVFPSVTANAAPFPSRDGIMRIPVTVRVPLASDHIRRRAEQYADLVPVHAKRHGLDARLLYAIIHTESFFNPRAQSPSPAYGLMQLVPRAGARDAYNYLYKDDQVLDDQYLLDPGHNIELGAGYLHLIRKDLIPQLPPGPKATDVMICAYHWGPGNVRTQILKQVRLPDLTEAQVSAVMAQRPPEPIRGYYRRVKDRMVLYDDLAR